MIFFKALFLACTLSACGIASSASEEEARHLYARNFYRAAMRSPSPTSSNALTPYSSLYSSFESDEEDPQSEIRWHALLSEKERSIRELLAIVQQQQVELSRQTADLQRLRRDNRAQEIALAQERKARQQKERALQEIQACYREHSRYQITLNRPLKYVKPHQFSASPWALTPEQRHAIGNLVTPEAGGLLTIKKI